MSLLDDIAAERAELAEELADLRAHVTQQARYQISQGGNISPIVAAIVGPSVEIFDLAWRSRHERTKVFDRVNAQLGELNATASLLVMPGNVGEADAVLFYERTPEGTAMSAIPYRRNRIGGVQWFKPISYPVPDDEYITVPALN